MKVDAFLTLYFGWIVVLWVHEYTEWQNYGECTNQFGLFWIAHFISISSFQILSYLEKFFYYLMALTAIEGDTTRLRRARFWAIVMSICKLFTYFGFMVLTILGGIWFVQEGRCLTKSPNGFNGWSTMLCWFFASAFFCLLSLMRLLTMKIYIGDISELIQGNSIGGMRSDHVQGQERSLTESEINAIKKSKLCSYHDLRWFHKAPLGKWQQSFIEMSNFVNNEPVSVEDNTTVFHDLLLNKEEEKLSKCSCAICKEDIEIGQWYKSLPKCEHWFHGPCIDQWLSIRATCPVCRAKVFVDKSTIELEGADEGTSQE